MPVRLHIIDVVGLKAVDRELGDLAIRVEIQATQEVAAIVDRRDRCAFSGRWLPIMKLLFDDCDEKALPLLHTLDVGLQTSRQFLYEFVPRYVVSWLGDEQLGPVVIVVRAGVDQLNIGHGTTLLELTLVNLIDGESEELFGVILHQNWVVSVDATSWRW